MCEWCEMKCLSIMFLRRLFFHPTSNIEHQQRDLAVETLKPLRVSTCALPSSVSNVRMMRDEVSKYHVSPQTFFFTQHPTLNINKGILQLRLLNRSGFQHVRYHLLYLMCEWCEMKCLSIMFLRRLFFHPTSNIEHQQRDLAVETLKPLRVSTCALPSSVSNVRMMRDEVSKYHVSPQTFLSPNIQHWTSTKGSYSWDC